MIKTLIQWIRSLCSSGNPVDRATEDAKTAGNHATQSVEAARATFRRTVEGALGTLAANKGSISEAITAENAAETERETARAAEVVTTTKEGEAVIEALIKALEQARRNADAALEALKAKHDDDRQAHATRIANAQAALAELVRLEGELSKAGC